MIFGFQIIWEVATEYLRVASLEFPLVSLGYKIVHDDEISPRSANHLAQ